MAIIYSYPLDNNPATGDLLLGTSIADGNATKSYTIASLVGLVNTQGGTGTVRTVSTANSTFITMQGGPITSTGTLVASLSAGGTPSNSTFLRGDNTWSPASTTGSPNIQVLDEGTSITTAVNSLNFIGTGATATAIGNAVTIDVPTAANAITSIIGGTGITVDQPIGDVTITNSGVLSLVAGSNITLTQAAGVFTINASNNPGTVQSVIAGSGLKLESASSTIISNPTIGIEYSGSNNYILIGESTAVVTENDIIAFNQLTSSNVKTTNFSTIPIAALPLVKTYIDAGDNNVVKNNTDTFNTTATINNVVTLLSAEYTALATKNVNTLYILDDTSPAPTASTVTLTPVNNNISGPAAGYVITGDVANATVSGIIGEPYTFTTIVTPAAGYYFSTPVTGNIISGTIAGTANVAQTLAGTIALVPTPSVTATLQVVTNIQGGPSSAYTIGGNTTGAVSTGTAPHNYAFTTTISNPPSNSAYTWLVAPVITNATGTISGSQTVITTITGTLQLV
tara:strand:- start:634 stop:2169 length:1536 start_codon:yes stop_codon:yes gene_type:complete